MDSMTDTLSDVYFSSDIPDLDFDLLNDMNYDFNLLGDDIEISNATIKQEFSPRSDSSDGSLVDPYSSTDSPPLTPPGMELLHQHVNIENESSKNVIVLNGSPNVQALPKILPAMKAGRGRSASHDSPDMQALKRHIRMIRNRESASLSRKKKKEYLTGLESRVKELEIENAKLKHENCVLKTRLGQIMNGSTISSAKNFATMLTTHSKTKALPSVTAKVALLGLCCFAFISFQKPPVIHHSNITEVHGMSIEPLPISLSHDMANMPVYHPSEKLKPKKPIFWKSSTVKRVSWKGKLNDTNLNETFDQLDEREARSTLANVTASELPNVNCPTPFNITEAKRVQDDLKGIFGRKSTPKSPVRTKPIVYSLIDSPITEDKGLAIYDEKVRRFSKVLDQLNRRSDTFYVVSLAVDNQLLLSAKNINATSRPKMSFLMPWKNDTRGGKEELMQIDCEVTQVYNLDKINQRRNRRFAK